MNKDFLKIRVGKPIIFLLLIIALLGVGVLWLGDEENQDLVKAYVFFGPPEKGVWDRTYRYPEKAWKTQEMKDIEEACANGEVVNAQGLIRLEMPHQCLVHDIWEAETNTRDWKTYRNDEFGFEVKLPEGCEFEKETKSEAGYFKLSSRCFLDDEGISYTEINGGISLNVFSHSDDLNRMAICRPEGIFNISSNQPLIEAEPCYQKLSSRRAGGMTTYYYSFTRSGDNKGYLFGISHDDESYNIKTEKAILESFRFID
ncbi:MAG: hypothetical protein KC736_05085 [Candidatus Moranbacteria bacterium]|nr:hypothetical protein [Candidatus Moranbacteria bacterium]